MLLIKIFKNRCILNFFKNPPYGAEVKLLLQLEVLITITGLYEPRCEKNGLRDC